MKIKLLVPRATATGAENCGDVIDAPNDEAIRMIEAGQAIPMDADPVERATKRTPKAEKRSD